MSRSIIATELGARRDRSVFAGRACRQYGVLLRPDSARSGHWSAGRWRHHGADAAGVRQPRRGGEAAGGSLAQIVRVGIYVTDLANFAAVNAVMAEYFQPPYPARSTIEVSGLPKAAQVEIDAVMVLSY
jgi:hypothetical protein